MASKSRQSSAPTSLELAAIEEQSEVVPPARAEAIPTSTDVLRESAEIIPTEGEVSEGGGEVALASEVTPAIETEAAPSGGDTSKGGAKSRPAPAAFCPKRATASDAVAQKGVAGKRAPLSEAIPVAPTSKKARETQLPTPALPPLEKGKTPVGLLSSAPDNEVLNAEEITPQSPASTVVELLRERIFGGVTEASDSHLLALTNLLACSTREQNSVDRQIEEARCEENLSATSDARGHLAVAQEHLKTLQGELSYTQDALKRVDERAAAAEVHRDEALEQLSSLVEIQRERDEAVGQRNEVWHQYKALKVDYDGA
ncbi:uncharacterized protein LOC110611549 [Manihot esculenta]|uniref:uncharacterized protein LOC110611549 n=1 Tax=Manihot esculenta TaxID=3983 RepID=UPI000B5D4E19|nr:uncharacterized protein LOC110611549 [Manihot esculenta]